MIRRRKPVETKVNHDRWLVSYADFITLLFAFFVVMYSVSQVNEQVYQQLVDTLEDAFDGRAHKPSTTATETGAGSANLADVRDLAREIEGALASLIETEQVQVTATDDWLEVTVNANLLFDSGKAAPSAEAEAVFAKLAEMLAPFENSIEVAGHTDNLPINNTLFSNNWELSAARATSIVSLLSNQGIAPYRLSATGYGEFRPVADNSMEAGRAKNRRVVLLVARHQATKPKVSLAELPQTLDTPTDAVSKGASRSAPTAEPAPQVPSDRALLKPIIREDGSLLFTSDPEKAVDAKAVDAKAVDAKAVEQ